MRERLIELISKFKRRCNYPCDGLEKSCNTCMKEQLADYLLANGVIVPPCKVGDIVKCDAIYYEIYRMASYSDFETPIHHRYWAEPINDEGEDDFWFWSDSIEEGTVVVCSKEDAENALKERERV